MSVRMTPRISANDPCWCHSNKKYKKCHRDRHREQPLEPGQLKALISRPFNTNKICLHPDAPTGCSKIIHAHTLQRMGIIRKLVSVDNHVQTFQQFDRDANGDPKIRKVGWRDASTFLGFCADHDSELFSPLEREPFTGDHQQILLAGYRALCHEVYQKQAATDVEPLLAKHADRGMPEDVQRVIQERLAVESTGRRMGLRELRVLKASYDRIAHQKATETLASVVIWFKGHPGIASTGTVHVDFDLRGKRLQNIARDPSPIHGLTFGLISTHERLRRLAGIPIQYGTPLTYSGMQHASWELTRVDRMT